MVNNIKSCRNCGKQLDESRYFNCKECVPPNEESIMRIAKQILIVSSFKTCKQCKKEQPTHLFSRSLRCTPCYNNNRKEARKK